MIPLMVGPLGEIATRAEDFAYNMLNSFQLAEIIQRVEESKIGFEDDTLPESIRQEARREYDILNKILEFSLSGSAKSSQIEFITEIE